MSELPCVKRIGFCLGAPGVSVGGQFNTTVEGEEILYRLYRADSAAFSMLEPEIVEDFHAPLYNSVWFGKKAFEATGFTAKQHDISQTLSQRTNGCEQVAGDKQIVLNYSGYLDDLIAENLRPQRNAMRLVEIFMLLSILIALLGLLAMSSYYAGESAKGIAIRKVFGGTVSSESWRTVREYMLMVAVACVIGIPISVWAAQRYLEGFIVKLEHYGWIFAVAALLTLAMAFLSVLWQTLRAARTNPARTLKAN